MPRPTPRRSRPSRASFIAMAGNLAFLLNSIGLAVSFTILLVTANTMSMAVRERRTEIAVLKTLGFSSMHVMGLIVAEAIALGAIGGGLGLSGSQGLMYILTHAPGIKDMLAGIDAARDAGVRVVTTYGSSETCGGCVYDGFPLEDVLVRVETTAASCWAGQPLPPAIFRPPSSRQRRSSKRTASAGTGPMTSVNWTPTAGSPCSAGPTTSSSPAASKFPPPMSRLSWKSSTACGRLCRRRAVREWGHAWPRTSPWPTVPRRAGGVRRPPERRPGHRRWARWPRKRSCPRGTAHAAQRETGPAGHDGPAGRAPSGKIDKPLPASGRAYSTNQRAFNQPTRY